MRNAERKIRLFSDDYQPLDKTRPLHKILYLLDRLFMMKIILLSSNFRKLFI